MSGERLSPCERCGIDTRAQYCGDCRYTDKDFTAGGRTVPEQQKWLNARRAQFEQREFWSWVREVAPSTAAGAPAAKKRRRKQQAGDNVSA